ncbi:MAG: hypothetical protein MIO92_03085 [Methanosarcinaceae archaeon]|nr:hypothetical protein [Methanosarcinaceae archaeon]
MITFKKKRMEEEFALVDRKLQKIVFAMEAVMDALYEKTLVITSVYRDNYRSTHYYYRAVDIRSSDLTHEQCMDMTRALNLIFPYGKAAYETVLYHNAGSGWHFHVQIKAENDGKRKLPEKLGRNYRESKNASGMEV